MLAITLTPHAKTYVIVVLFNKNACIYVKENPWWSINDILSYLSVCVLGVEATEGSLWRSVDVHCGAVCDEWKGGYSHMEWYSSQNEPAWRS